MTGRLDVFASLGGIMKRMRRRSATSASTACSRKPLAKTQGVEGPLRPFRSHGPANAQAGFVWAIASCPIPCAPKLAQACMAAITGDAAECVVSMASLGSLRYDGLARMFPRRFSLRRYVLTSIQRLSLWCGVCVPLVYFGAQLVAAPFYPDYSFMVNSASQLGSDRSSFPQLLNVGAMLSGALGLLSVYGVVSGLRAHGANRWFAWISGACVVSIAAAAIWAGLHPMPDPRHNPGAIGIGMFLSPLALFAAFWKVRDGRAMRRYLIFTLIAFAALAPVMSGITPIDLERYGGLMQRIAALVLYVPPSVSAWWLLRKHPPQAKAPAAG